MAQFKQCPKVTVFPVNLPFAEFIDDVLPEKINLAKADIRQEVQGLNLELEQKISKVELDFAEDFARADALALENKRIADEALDEVFKQADEIENYRIRLDSIDDTLRGVGETAAKASLTALDAIGKILDIGNFILQLGTAARMEFIYNELKNQNIIFQQALEEIYARLANINATDAQQQSAIEDLYRLLDMNNSQFDSLLGAIQALSQYLMPIYNNSFQALYRIDNLIDLELATQTQIGSGFGALPPQMKTAVCEALNSGCFDFPECDFSEIIDKLDNLSDGNGNGLLNTINNKLGQFPNNCGHSSVAHGLCAGGGGGGVDFNEALEDYFSNNEAVDLQPVLDKIESKGNEVIEEIKNIPEPTLYVPDEWAIKLEGDRPQLIAGMQDAAKAGTGSASKWQIVIPRPKSSVLSMDWDELSAYFPKYNRGAWAAIAKLKDGSVMRVRASSQSAARTYLNRMMDLVDPAYATSENFLFQYNERFKSVSVVCRGIAYYANGRKDGEKPTKRWYFPVEDQQEQP